MRSFKDFIVTKDELADMIRQALKKAGYKVPFFDELDYFNELVKKYKIDNDIPLL